MPWIEFASKGTFVEVDVPEEELYEMKQTCMCGDYVKDHEPYFSNHSPVSMYDYWRYADDFSSQDSIGEA